MGSHFGWMNIHLPPILMFTRGKKCFDPQPNGLFGRDVFFHFSFPEQGALEKSWAFGALIQLRRLKVHCEGIHPARFHGAVSGLRSRELDIHWFRVDFFFSGRGSESFLQEVRSKSCCFGSFGWKLATSMDQHCRLNCVAELLRQTLGNVNFEFIGRRPRLIEGTPHESIPSSHKTSPALTVWNPLLRPFEEIYSAKGRSIFVGVF